jgi:hypothetical protein
VSVVMSRAKLLGWMLNDFEYAAWLQGGRILPIANRTEAMSS